jgi:hypothetical protein
MHDCNVKFARKEKADSACPRVRAEGPRPYCGEAINPKCLSWYENIVGVGAHYTPDSSTALARGGTDADVASGMGANIELVTGLHNLETRGGKDAARRISLADN